MLPSFLQNLDPQVYHSDNYVVLDFETDTSHGDYGSAVHADNNLLLACWKVSLTGAMKSCWGSEYDMGELISDIEKADFLVAHNAKYELMWLERSGLDISKVCVFDTKIGEYVIFGNLAAGDERMPPRSTSLDQCCRRRGWPIKDPLVDSLISSGINPVSIPRPALQSRCMQDVTSAEKLFKHQLARMDRTGLLPVQYTRCLLTPVLANLEFVGMCLDPDRVDEEFAEYQRQYAEYDNEMEAMTGGINWRSPVQVGEYLYDTLGFPELKNRDGTPKRTKKGKRLTDKHTLEKLNPTTKGQKDFVSLRAALGKVGSALSKNLEFFKGVCDELGGVFKATFNQTNTATHRLSSSGIPTLFALFDKSKTVQFQNLPRVFKRLFRAKRKGWLIGEADGSQLEFRVAAHLGRCDDAKNLIVENEDIHALSTMIQYDLTREQLDELKEKDPKKYKKWRTDSKSWTFQPLYGGEGILKKQKEYARAFREAYPGIHRAQERWCQEVGQTKSLLTEWGLRFYWPYAKFKRKYDGSLALNCKNAVYNYPVQCFATAEIIPIAVVYMFHRIREEGLEDKIVLVNTVHDSVIVELHPDYVDHFRSIAKRAFTHDVYEYLERVYGISFDFVPLGVGITVGEHWNEGEEEAYNIYYDGTEERTE